MKDDLNQLLNHWSSATTGRPPLSEYRERVFLPRSDPPLVAAAGYLGLMAYGDNVQKVEQLIESIFAYLAKGRRDFLGKYDTPKEWRELPNKNMYARLRAAQNKIWFERFPATESAMMIHLERTTRSKAIRFRGPKTVEEAGQYFESYIGRSASNFKGRIWSPTKQVFHLVKPFYNFVQSIPPGPNGKRMALARFVSKDPYWVEDCVRQSRSFEAVLISSGIVKKKELINVDWQD